MINLSKYTDPYERKARLYPALLCIFPVIVAISISYPSIYKTLSGIVVLGAAIGMMQFISHLARDKGKAIEYELFHKWGGIPSVVVMRYSDNAIAPPAKVKYHSILSKKSGIQAPTREDEESNPESADEVYLSWSDFLRGKTRDTKKYHLVFKENINYGFRRNLLGLKWFCVVFGVIGLAILNLPIISGKEFTDTMLFMTTLIVIYTLIFVFVVNSNWVKVVAKEYGKQLVEAINA